MKIFYSSEVDLALPLVGVSSQFKHLAPSNHQHPSPLAGSALEFEGDLFGGFGLLAEDGFGLASESLLLGVVPPLALGSERSLSCLVLRHLVVLMLLALLTKCLPLLWCVHLHLISGLKLPFL